MKSVNKCYCGTCKKYIRKNKKSYIIDEILLCQNCNNIYSQALQGILS